MYREALMVGDKMKVLLFSLLILLAPALVHAVSLVSVDSAGLHVTTVAPAPVLSTVAGGNVPAGTYFYVLTLRTATGETTKSGEVKIVTATTGSVLLTWTGDSTAVGHRVFRSTVSGVYGANTYLGEFVGTTHTDIAASVTSSIVPPASSTVPSVLDAGNSSIILNQTSTFKKIVTTGE
jgi:hypothetical protein